MTVPIAGLVGPPNVGKSTFFAAATLINVKISPYPFTTIEPNVGIAYIRIKCVCTEFGVKDNPRNSICIKGNRFIPVKLIDVAGLVPDAWKGRGLGNRFLDHMRRASVILLVVDASGSTTPEGKIVKPGTHNPIEDVEYLEREVTMWMWQKIEKDWKTICRQVEVARKNLRDVLLEKLSGFGITKDHISKALDQLSVDERNPSKWSENQKLELIQLLKHYSKPTLIVANKADIPEAEENIKNMKKELGHKYIIIPASAEAELALRRAAQKGLIEYLPGDPNFKILSRDKLTKQQLKALEYIRENVLEKWGSTGVQQAINQAFLKLLGYVAVFPVENEIKLTDHKGNVLS